MVPDIPKVSLGKLRNGAKYRVFGHEKRFSEKRVSRAAPLFSPSFRTKNGVFDGFRGFLMVPWYHGTGTMVPSWYRGTSTRWYNGTMELVPRRYQDSTMMVPFDQITVGLGVSNNFADSMTSASD